MKVSGFKELQKKLQNISAKVNELDDINSVPLGELLSPKFLSKHTSFDSPEHLFEHGGFKVNSVESFRSIAPPDLDEYIQSVSSFSTWHEMLAAASKEWMLKKIEL